MTKFTKLFCTAFLLLAGGVSASAQDVQEAEGEKVYATFESPSGIDWDADNKIFSWSSQWGNQLHNIGLPTGNLSEYVQLVVDCEVLEGDGYRFMFYSGSNFGTTAGGLTIVEKANAQSGNSKRVYNLADFEMDSKYITECSEICLSGWNASGKVKVNSVYLIKSSNPLAGFKKQLSDAITAAKAKNAYGKTEASWAALTQAIAAGEAALAAEDATQESLEAATQAINNAINGLELEKGYSNITIDMFHAWTSPNADATVTEDAVYPANEIGKTVGQGTTVWGDPSVRYLQYADITNYDQLVITGTPAFVARLCLNRAVPVEGGDANGGAYIEIIEPLNEDGVLVIDLKNYEKLQGVEYIHLNSFKTPWNGMEGTFSDLLLYKEPVVTDIEISPAEGDIAAALAAAKEDVDIVGNITINLTEGVTYTVSATLTAPNNLTINGNGATVDASALTAPFITIDGTEVFAMKDAETASDHKYVALDSISALTITGLQDALIKDVQKTLLETFVIEDCNIQMPAAGKNVVDFNSKGYVGRVSVVNSTIWAAGMNTGFFAQYGSRPKNINGDWLQQFVFENNTIVNIANGKNFNDMKQNGTAQNVYTLKNNIFVNSGKDKQVVVGFNKGQASATPVWDVDGNYFMVGDACTNADEIAKAGKQGEEDIVKNCAEGLLTFTDAAAGNFNGEFTPAEGAEAPESLGDPRWTIETVIPVTHTWDFTKWSEATVTNLKAEAAKVEVMDDPDNEGNTLLVSDNGALWSDHEKAKDKTCDTYAASKDNCFWYIGGEAEPTANGEAIAELKGLQFNASYGTSRSLAIAVNYPSTALGEYAGPSYLWFGGKGKECFTIPSVKGGTTITMGVESHKIAEARGVQLLVDGTALNDPEGNPVAAPTTYTEQTWQVPEGAAVDVLVKNTNGCHIYFIDAEIDETPVGINDIQQSVVKSDVIYNLNGQQVKNAQKGLYIINGKKVIVK